MSLAKGSKLGVYEIIAPIGAGGMGEVYRARDPKLKRDVAIKVLPEDFAEDAERMKRFEREAQLLASLNHPHIAAIYGLEQNALILELVEGPTLAQRIEEGPLAWEEALRIALQIAEALEYAHDNGIIHRDLKPANVKLTGDGDVKVLDYGLAKALGDRESGEHDDSQSPTLTRAGTQAGVLLGTAGYMSPEQAKGKAVDRRGDIWAFGVVLFEMLTGQRLFSGETASETLAAVIKDEPDWSRLPSETPSHIRKLLRRCLTRDPKERLQAIGEARIALARPEEEEAVAVVATPAPLWRRALPWVVAGLFGFAWVSVLSTPREPNRVTRLSAEIGADASLYLDQGPAAILSPDGSTLAFVATATDGQDRRLFVRRLDRTESFRGLDWNELADYLSERTRVHGERRGREMEEAAKTLKGLGVEPIMAEAAAKRLLAGDT